VVHRQCDPDPFAIVRLLEQEPHHELTLMHLQRAFLLKTVNQRVAIAILTSISCFRECLDIYRAPLGA
jgi:hypothetical protein